jgi:hypothetical protein
MQYPYVMHDTRFILVFYNVSRPNLGRLKQLMIHASCCQGMCFNPNLKALVLLNALTFTFTRCITLKFDAASIEILNEPLICDDFDLESQEFK